jgi:hypothetical protein
MKKIAFVLALMASSSAFAAVKGGKFGMDFGFGETLGLWTLGSNGTAQTPSFNGMPTVGFRYHIIDMVAVNVSGGFATGSGTNNNVSGAKTENSFTAWGIGLEVPIYLLKLNLMDFYVAPGFGFTPMSIKSKTTNAAGTVTNETTDSRSYMSFYAAVGLQIPINDQLHAFGKTTIGYATGTTNPNTNANATNAGDTDDKHTYFGLQSWSVGAIFYFN